MSKENIVIGNLLDFDLPDTNESRSKTSDQHAKNLTDVINKNDITGLIKFLNEIGTGPRVPHENAVLQNTREEFEKRLMGKVIRHMTSQQYGLVTACSFSTGKVIPHARVIILDRKKIKNGDPLVNTTWQAGHFEEISASSLIFILNHFKNFIY